MIFFLNYLVRQLYVAVVMQINYYYYYYSRLGQVHQENYSGLMVQDFLPAGCPSCQPTSNVKSTEGMNALVYSNV